MTNTRIVYVVGESQEGLGRIIEQENHAAKGIDGKGQRNRWIAHTGPDAANEHGSADTVNGIGEWAYSQNLAYQLEIRNSGMNITGAPTLNAFTQGSVLFIGASKVLSQDNTNLFWDDGADTLKAKNAIVFTKAVVGTTSLGSEVFGVTGNAKVTTYLGVGGAPDTTHALLVTGLAEVTSRMGIGGAADATITALITGTLKSTGDFTVGSAKFVVTATTGATAIAGDVTVNTNKWILTASTGAVAQAGDLTINTNKFVVTASTGATVVASYVDSLGLRATATSAPAAGVGVEIGYNTGASIGYLLAFDRTGSTYKDFALYGLSVDLSPSGTSKLKVNGTGVGFFGTTPVAQQAGGAATADTTWSAGEVTMLQKVYDAVRAVGIMA